MFYESGIPVVITVNLEQDDQACKLFTREFYQNLLDGDTILEAFQKASNLAKECK